MVEAEEEAGSKCSRTQDSGLNTVVNKKQFGMY